AADRPRRAAVPRWAGSAGRRGPPPPARRTSLVDGAVRVRVPAHAGDGAGQLGRLAQLTGQRLGRLTTIPSWLLRAMTTTASSGPGFSSRCGTNGGTYT